VMEVSRAYPPTSARAPLAPTAAASPIRTATSRTLLLQEARGDVRPVDVDVAARAVPIARLEVVRGRDRVALVAELRHLLADQQMAVHAAVRVVAADAPLGHEPGVLVHERPLEVSVAAVALAVVRPAGEPPVARPVRLVAGEARHHSPVHPLGLGGRALGAHLEVAAVAEIRRLLRQQAVADAAVHPVTVGAGDTRERVLAALEVVQALGAGMALEADGGALGCGNRLREGLEVADTLPASRLRV